ncbi:hypothetical protein GCM10028803_55170 [Larkinella knui]|nr:cyclophilin-like fold protein [Larkinella knui]
MKPSIVVLFQLLFFIGIMACKTDDPSVSNQTGTENGGNTDQDTTKNRLRIRIGSQIFTATLLDNATVTAFRARLPMTVVMGELNGNEKLYRFSSDLPTNPANPGTIQTGDLMLYGANTLVLFYQTFPTPYSYTKLGRIVNTAGLAAAVGSGSVTITFELE